MAMAGVDDDDEYCNTELCLSPSSVPQRSQCPSSSLHTKSTRIIEGCEAHALGPHQQRITLFYGGRVFTRDVTEIQATAIICMAKREMEGRLKMVEKSKLRHIEGSSSPAAAEAERLAPQLLQPGLSMKRSLHQFLAKRKCRANAASPYKHSSTPSP